MQYLQTTIERKVKTKYACTLLKEDRVLGDMSDSWFSVGNILDIYLVIPKSKEINRLLELCQKDIGTNLKRLLATKGTI